MAITQRRASIFGVIILDILSRSFLESTHLCTMCNYSFFRLSFILVIWSLISTDINSQVHLDFSTNTTGDWQIELDGEISYNAINGNPGGCMRVDDDASGVLNLLVAPYDLLGDWSGSDTSDFIAFDYLVHRFGGTPFMDSEFVIQISGPAGSAKALFGYVYDSLDVWEEIVVKIDSSEWYEINGNWEDILLQVDLVKLRSEYIFGDEYVLIDNVELSFSPDQSPLDGQVCSSFETFDGWSFTDVASASVDTFGRPENSIELKDKLAVNSTAIAPPKFRGDWTNLDTTDNIQFDIYISTNDPDRRSLIDLVTLTGNGNEAVYQITSSDVDSAYNQWYRFELPIDEDDWQINSGTWTDLIDAVQLISLELEFIIGTETVYLDNFCIGDEDCPQSIVLYGETIDSTLRAQDFIILDSVQLMDQATISAPSVILKNETHAPLGNVITVDNDGCN